MNLTSVMRDEQKLLLPTYDRQKVLFTRGRGVYLWDSKGKRYLDFLSGIGVNALGTWASGDSESAEATGREADSHLESLLSRVSGGTGEAADENLRARSRILLQQRD